MILHDIHLFCRITSKRRRGFHPRRKKKKISRKIRFVSQYSRRIFICCARTNAHIVERLLLLDLSAIGKKKLTFFTRENQNFLASTGQRFSTIRRVLKGIAIYIFVEAFTLSTFSSSYFVYFSSDFFQKKKKFSGSVNMLLCLSVSYQIYTHDFSRINVSSKFPTKLFFQQSIR